MGPKEQKNRIEKENGRETTYKLPSSGICS